jgi:flagellar motility protein MotE (MotC chaperone)
MLKNKKLIFLSLIGLPLALVLTLIIMYVALFGSQLPFDLEWKVQLPDGKWINKKDVNTHLVKNASDSLFVLYDGISVLRDSTNTLKMEMNSLEDSVMKMQQMRVDYSNQIASLEKRIDDYETQKRTIEQEKISRLDKIFKEINQDNLDSLFIASLDDRAIMSIIASAKAKQAAAILQRVEPKRAANITSKYLSDRK